MSCNELLSRRVGFGVVFVTSYVLAAWFRSQLLSKYFALNETEEEDDDENL